MSACITTLVRRPEHRGDHVGDGGPDRRRSPTGRHVRRAALPYWHLVLACGAAPSPLPAPGGGSALYLRSLADAVALRATAAHADSAVVIGAGFIGCEAAASLAMRGLAVTLVAPERLPQEARLGVRRANASSACCPMRACGSSVRSRSRPSTRTRCASITASPSTAIWCWPPPGHPRSALAADAGLTTHNGRIVVDERMHTSALNVLAAGDVALAWNRTAGRRIAVEHWQDAVDQGAIAGTTAAGASAVWDGVPGFWSTIGDATLKYHAWGDGYEHSRLVQRQRIHRLVRGGGAAVGVLTSTPTRTTTARTTSSGAAIRCMRLTRFSKNLARLCGNRSDRVNPAQRPRAITANSLR